MTARPTNIYAMYHAHVYFDESSVARAQTMCKEAARRFAVAMGRVHERLVGPHPAWSCQLAFDAPGFDALIPWLEANRGGLTVLVHGLTGNDLADHTTHASWLGEPAVLDLRAFSGIDVRTSRERR